jgi:hypothetical protein
MATMFQKIAILKTLEREDGSILPEDVVAVAENPGHALHSDFEWDNEIAGPKYRLGQARSLIRAVRLHYKTSSVPLAIQIPAYVRDLRAETSGYRAVLQIRDDRDVARDTVIDAMSRAAAAMRRAKTLAVVFDTEDLIDQIEGLVGEVVRRVNINEQPGGEA